MTDLEIAKAMAYVRAQVAKVPPHEELFAAIEALLTFESEPETKPFVPVVVMPEHVEPAPEAEAPPASEPAQEMK